MILGATLALAVLSGPGDSPGDDVRAHVGDTKDTLDFIRNRATEEERSLHRPQRSDARFPQFTRAAACREAAAAFVKGLDDGTCPAGAELALAFECPAAEPRLPLWRRNPVGAAGWGPWEQIDAGGCGDLLPTLTAQDFRSLPLAKPVLRLQPDRGWVLVNMPTIVMTDTTPQRLRTTLLGRGVEVVAEPTTFTYDFGDGSAPLTTTSPGQAWPDQDTFHVYQRLGSARITLTTTWAGRYRIDGADDWHDVDGTAFTATTSNPIEIREYRTRLVAETCDQNPHAPGC